MYKKIVMETRKKVSKITLQQQREVLKIYDDAIKELSYRANLVGIKPLDERWTVAYVKELKKARNDLARELNKSIRGYTTKAARVGMEPEQLVLGEIFKKASIKVKPTFDTLFNTIHQNIVNDIISGNLYKDGKTLSGRIWSYSNEFEKDIQYIINQAMLGKKSAVDLAKDLEQFVRVPAKRTTDWGKVYPMLAGKKVDYNAMRLARTTINHAYQTATIQSSQVNPFVEGVEWHSAMQHGRTCEICRERHGQVFPKDDVPLDHPNGLCTLIPYMPKSLDEVGTELRDWVDGGKNKMLDDWYRNYGEHFI